jgi:hypothetical protein
MPDRSTKVYAKLSIDVAECYSSSGMLSVEREMESGHGKAPIIHAQFALERLGDEVRATAADERDPSFADGPDKPIPLDDWDRTIEGSDASDWNMDIQEKPKKSKRKHHTRGRLPREEEPVGVSQPDDSAIDEQRAAPEEDPAPPVAQLESRSRAEQTEQLESPEQVVGVSTQLNSDTLGLLKDVFQRSWAHSTAPFIDRLVFPTLVFPVFATALRTKLLLFDTDDSTFEEGLRILAAGVMESSDSVRQRLLLILALALLVREYVPTFVPLRAARLTSILESAFIEHFSRVVQRILINGEVLLNRFVTAAFDFGNLLHDFREVAHDIKTKAHVSPTIDTFLVKAAFWTLERLAVNKLVRYPERFNFTNAMTWNSFLTAFENDERTLLPLLRQVISALVLPLNIARDPPLIPDICPDIPPGVIAFFLANYGKDVNIPDAIDVQLFNSYWAVRSVHTPEPFPLEFPIDLEELRKAAHVENWCVVAWDDENLAEMEDLRAYKRPG